MDEMIHSQGETRIGDEHSPEHDEQWTAPPVSYSWVTRKRKDGMSVLHCVKDTGKPGHYQYARALCGITGPFSDHTMSDVTYGICGTCDSIWSNWEIEG